MGRFSGKEATGNTAGKECQVAQDVRLHVPSLPVGVADVSFVVRRNGRKFGELRISKGTVVWLRAGKTYGRKLRWDQIDQLAHQEGKRHRPTF